MRNVKAKFKKKMGGGAKVLAKEPNPKVPHLVFLLKLSSENLRATPRRRPDSHPSSPSWT